MAKGKSKGKGGGGGATKSVSERSYDLAAKNPDYIGDGYGYDAKTINAYTQEGYNVNTNILNGTLDEQDKAFIKNLDLALSKLPTSPKQELFRGVNLPNDIFKEYKVGSIIEFKGFLSTSFDKREAERFLKGTDPNKTPTLLNIKSHKNGKDVSKISNYEDESEIAFKRNTKWKITSINGENITIEEV